MTMTTGRKGKWLWLRLSMVSQKQIGSIPVVVAGNLPSIHRQDMEWGAVKSLGKRGFYCQRGSCTLTSPERCPPGGGVISVISTNRAWKLIQSPSARPSAGKQEWMSFDFIRFQMIRGKWAMGKKSIKWCTPIHFNLFGAGVASLTAGKNAEGSRPAGDGDCRFRFPVLERENGCRSAPLAPVLFRFRADRWNRMAAFFRLFFGGMVLQPGRERRSIVSFVFKEQSAAGQMAGRKDSSPGSPESMAETSSVSTQEMEQPAVRPGGFRAQVMDSSVRP